MANSEFIHWEELDLDALLGEYTDNDLEMDSDGEDYSEDIAETTTGGVELEKQPQETPTSQSHSHQPSVASVYACPQCEKTYKSIAGFRGHVTKKHDRSDLRGECKLDCDIFIHVVPHENDLEVERDAV